MCAVSVEDTNYLVMHEDTGEPGDVIEGGSIYRFVCVLRGWDNDAIEQLFQDAFVKGDVSQHAVFKAPGDRKAGTSAMPRAVRLAYVPDDVEHVSGVVCYNAIPDFTPNESLAFQRATELGLPLTFQCLRDDSGRILEIGRLADISPT